MRARVCVVYVCGVYVKYCLLDRAAMAWAYSITPSAATDGANPNPNPDIYRPPEPRAPMHLPDLLSVMTPVMVLPAG